MNAADQQLAQGAPEVGIEFDAVVVGAGFGGTEGGMSPRQAKGGEA